MSGVLKLLILLNEKNDKNAGFTQARYTPGTRFADAADTRDARLGPVHSPKATCLRARDTRLQQPSPLLLTINNSKKSGHLLFAQS